MALDIDKVFRFVQFVSNKEFRGWITPAHFNLAAELAQLTLYSEKEAEYAATKKLSVDMKPFLLKAAGTPSSGVVAISGALADFRFPISAYITATLKPVKEVDDSELPSILDSEILAPTSSYPIAVYYDTTISIYPADDVSVTFAFLKKPTTPLWDYTVVSSRPVYASGTSVDFGFDEPMFLPIASRILSHVGMNLKDTELAQFGAAFEEKGQ
jgi:hypothetical protein